MPKVKKAATAPGQSTLFTCKDCAGRTFKSRSALNNHRRFKHKDFAAGGAPMPRKTARKGARSMPPSAPTGPQPINLAAADLPAQIATSENRLRELAIQQRLLVAEIVVLIQAEELNLAMLRGAQEAARKAREAQEAGESRIPDPPLRTMSAG